MSMVRVEFLKDHYVDGILYGEGDQIDIDESRLNPGMRRLDGVSGHDESRSDPFDIKSTDRKAKAAAASHNAVRRKKGDSAADPVKPAQPVKSAQQLKLKKPSAENPEQPAEQPERSEVPSADRNRILLSALMRLDQDSDDDWDTKGHPRISRVEELSGLDTSRKELDAIAPNVRRNRE